MDNVTHTLVGLIIGESAHSHAAPHDRGLTPAARRAAIVSVALIGSNLPDIDLLVSVHGSSVGNLGYMLWHRGYTHTVVGCALLAFLLYAGAELVLRIRRLSPTTAERGLLLGTALFATALHLGMDWLNSYGVHPFWPADNRWRYGDSVFIVEPLYWVAAAPLWWGLRRSIARLLFVLALIAAVTLGLVSALISGISGFVLLAGFLFLAATGARLSAKNAARLSTLLALAVTLAFVAGGRVAARRSGEIAAAAFPNDRLLDRVLTPQPANPVCWDLWLLETSEGLYVARHGSLTLAPAWISSRACAPGKSSAHASPQTAVRSPDNYFVHWLGETRLQVTALRQLVDTHCEAAAFMLFARAPFIASNPDILGDLRFDRDAGGAGFSVPLAGKSDTCKRAAPWTAPRVDLLGR